MFVVSSVLTLKEDAEEFFRCKGLLKTTLGGGVQAVISDNAYTIPSRNASFVWVPAGAYLLFGNQPVWGSGPPAWPLGRSLPLGLTLVLHYFYFNYQLHCTIFDCIALPIIFDCTALHLVLL